MNQFNIKLSGLCFFTDDSTTKADKKEVTTPEVIMYIPGISFHHGFIVLLCLFRSVITSQQVS